MGCFGVIGGAGTGSNGITMGKAAFAFGMMCVSAMDPDWTVTVGIGVTSGIGRTATIGGDRTSEGNGSEPNRSVRVLGDRWENATTGSGATGAVGRTGGGSLGSGRDRTSLMGVEGQKLSKVGGSVGAGMVGQFSGIGFTLG